MRNTLSTVYGSVLLDPRNPSGVEGSGAFCQVRKHSAYEIEDTRSVLAHEPAHDVRVHDL